MENNRIEDYLFEQARESGREEEIKAKESRTEELQEGIGEDEKALELLRSLKASLERVMQGLDKIREVLNG